MVSVRQCCGALAIHISEGRIIVQLCPVCLRGVGSGLARFHNCHSRPDFHCPPTHTMMLRSSCKVIVENMVRNLCILQGWLVQLTLLTYTGLHPDLSPHTSPVLLVHYEYFSRTKPDRNTPGDTTSEA